MVVETHEEEGCVDASPAVMVLFAGKCVSMAGIYAKITLSEDGTSGVMNICGDDATCGMFAF